MCGANMRWRGRHDDMRNTHRPSTFLNCCDVWPQAFKHNGQLAGVERMRLLCRWTATTDMETLAKFAA